MGCTGSKPQDAQPQQRKSAAPTVPPAPPAPKPDVAPETTTEEVPPPYEEPEATKDINVTQEVSAPAVEGVPESGAMPNEVDIPANNEEDPSAADTTMIDGDAKQLEADQEAIRIQKSASIEGDGPGFTGDMNERGERHGQGKCVYENGSVYEGSWKNNLKDGMGKYTFSRGDVYEGEFRDGKMNGKGKYMYMGKRLFYTLSLKIYYCCTYASIYSS